MLIGALRPAGSDSTLDWNKDRCLNQFSRPKSLNLSRWFTPANLPSAASEPSLRGVISAIIIIIIIIVIIIIIIIIMVIIIIITI